MSTSIYIVCMYTYQGKKGAEEKLASLAAQDGEFHTRLTHLFQLAGPEGPLECGPTVVFRTGPGFDIRRSGGRLTGLHVYRLRKRSIHRGEWEPWQIPETLQKGKQ